MTIVNTAMAPESGVVAVFLYRHHLQTPHL